MEPKVSVIIPVYNAEKYLRQCLDSVINQSLREIEIICVDDGSTDGSRIILEEYAACDERLRLIYNEKTLYAGLSRNRGLEAANGEYVFFWMQMTGCWVTGLKLYMCKHAIPMRMYSDAEHSIITTRLAR